MSDVVKDQPLLYTVACQKESHESVHIYKIKSNSRVELIQFVKRILHIDALSRPAFLEIHEERGNGQIAVVYGDSRRQWPKKATIVRHDAIMGPKPKTEVIDARIDQSKLPAILGPTPLQLVNEAIQRHNPATQTVNPTADAGLVVSELRDLDVAWVKPLIIKVA